MALKLLFCYIRASNLTLGDFVHQRGAYHSLMEQVATMQRANKWRKSKLKSTDGRVDGHVNICTTQSGEQSKV